MPFLEEKELLSLQEEIKLANEEKEETENELREVKETLEKVKRNSKKINIFFGVLAGIALGLAIYFFTNRSSTNMSSDDIVALKIAEAERVIDSLQNLAADDTNLEQEQSESIDADLERMKSSIAGETVYSVQIGAFSNNRYPLLSEIIAGTTSKGELLKYSVGLFKTLKEAQKFRKELVKLGFEDAFVASYIDGKRQQIEQPN